MLHCTHSALFPLAGSWGDRRRPDWLCLLLWRGHLKGQSSAFEFSLGGPHSGLFGHRLFLFPWGVHSNAVLGRLVTDMFQQSFALCLDCFLSGVHPCPVVQIYICDFVWTKDFEEAPQALVVENLKPLRHGGGGLPTLLSMQEDSIAIIVYQSFIKFTHITEILKGLG